MRSHFERQKPRVSTRNDKGHSANWNLWQLKVKKKTKHEITRNIAEKNFTGSLRPEEE